MSKLVTALLVVTAAAAAGCQGISCTDSRLPDFGPGVAGGGCGPASGSVDCYHQHGYDAWDETTPGGKAWRGYGIGAPGHGGSCGDGGGGGNFAPVINGFGGGDDCQDAAIPAGTGPIAGAVAAGTGRGVAAGLASRLAEGGIRRPPGCAGNTCDGRCGGRCPLALIGRPVAAVVGKHRCRCQRGFRGLPMGPESGAVTYPYYTLRGPRDFLLSNPPSIGP